MGEHYTFALSVFTGFFAVMNPLANAPVFLSLAGDRSPLERQRIARSSCLVAFGIVLAFILFGKLIFDLFGITIPAFKVTGGILLFFTGFDMLRSQAPKAHRQEAVAPEADDIAVSPLGIPILAGPGTIVTAMNGVTDAGPGRIAIVVLVLGLMVGLTYLSFTLSDRLVARVGGNLMKVFEKLLGLILAIVGTGMCMSGIKLAFAP